MLYSIINLSESESGYELFIIGCGLGNKRSKFDNSTALKVRLGMSQSKEFAFIVMKAGQEDNLV